MTHCFSFIDEKTEFEGNNRFDKGTNISNSKIGRHIYTVSARICSANIGSFCSIGPEALIDGLAIHPTNLISTHPIFYSQLKQSSITFASQNYFEENKAVTIGNDVWIGARSLILDGINIGYGVIVAAGALVCDDVPPYAIVGGVPAKIIRYRFSKDIIVEVAMVDSKW